MEFSQVDKFANRHLQIIRIVCVLFLFFGLSFLICKIYQGRREQGSSWLVFNLCFPSPPPGDPKDSGAGPPSWGAGKLGCHHSSLSSCGNCTFGHRAVSPLFCHMLPLNRFAAMLPAQHGASDPLGPLKALASLSCLSNQARGAKSSSAQEGAWEGAILVLSGSAIGHLGPGNDAIAKGNGAKRWEREKERGNQLSLTAGLSL